MVLEENQPFHVFHSGFPCLVYVGKFSLFSSFLLSGFRLPCVQAEQSYVIAGCHTTRQLGLRDCQTVIHRAEQHFMW